MKLGLMERLLAMELLPKESDWAGVKEIRKAKEILSFTAEEMEKFQVQQENGLVGWNAEGSAYVKDLPITEWATTQIQEALRKKNHDKKLTERDVNIYKIFITDYDQV
jgi:nicotinic acid mononucleotide adenylyltransferase